MKKKSITLFCGSRIGKQAEYQQSAVQLGELLSRLGITMIYGGAKIGLMGLAADTCLKNQGRVCGIMPRFLGSVEIVHNNLSELIWVETMEERKRLMIEKADGFVVLPGGWGTLDEMYEVLTLHQVGRHQKPLWLINTREFFAPVLSLHRHMVQEAFLAQQHLDLVHCVSSIEQLGRELEQLKVT